ncbi:MAG: T9SS type A sorting domain-containing protein [Flavisolibacter sp.]
MKQLFSIIFSTLSIIAVAQPIVQPLASGDYWRIREYNQKLQEFANRTVMEAPAVGMRYPSGFAIVADLDAQRKTGYNEISWHDAPVSNVFGYLIEYSRNNHDFEKAGVVNLYDTKNTEQYVFKHRFYDDRPVYYRIGIIDNNGIVVAFTPGVELRSEGLATRIYPTQVRNHEIFVQTAEPFERLQVLNSAGQAVYEKALADATGTLRISLPVVTAGIYFIRLTRPDGDPYVQKVMVE